MGHFTYFSEFIRTGISASQQARAAHQRPLRGRVSAQLRHADAPAPGADRGHCGVAGSRQRSVHDVGVRAQSGRRTEGRREQFRKSCDNS
jgi:hypothetical protein